MGLKINLVFFLRRSDRIIKIQCIWKLEVNNIVMGQVWEVKSAHSWFKYKTFSKQIRYSFDKFRNYESINLIIFIFLKH